MTLIKFMSRPRKFPDVGISRTIWREQHDRHGQNHDLSDGNVGLEITVNDNSRFNCKRVGVELTSRLRYIETRALRLTLFAYKNKCIRRTRLKIRPIMPLVSQLHWNEIWIRLIYDLNKWVSERMRERVRFIILQNEILSRAIDKRERN